MHKLKLKSCKVHIISILSHFYFPKIHVLNWVIFVEPRIQYWNLNIWFKFNNYLNWENIKFVKKKKYIFYFVRRDIGYKLTQYDRRREKVHIFDNYFAKYPITKGTYKLLLLTLHAQLFQSFSCYESKIAIIKHYRGIYDIRTT